jgi:transcriptional regulator with XRE-family HTH domain
MMKDFVTWLTDEMNARGWTNSELARRAGVRQSTVSMVISGHNKPGDDLCLGIARAFHVPAEEVFRRAGILPPLPAPENDITFDELLSYMKRLSAEDRKDVLEYAIFRYRRAQPSREANPGNDAASAEATA